MTLNLLCFRFFIYVYTYIHRGGSGVFFRGSSRGDITKEVKRVIHIKK